MRLPSLKNTGFYYGWLVVVGAFLATGLTVGTSQYAFGVFVEPLESEFGWTRTQLNAAISLSAFAALLSPLVGRMMDRYGARPVMAASLVALAVSYVLRPLMSELWHWYILSVALSLAMLGTTALPTGKLVGMWFQKTRGRMMGIATMGNNFGGLTMTPLAGFVVGMAGWRWGYGVFAVMCFALAPLMMLMIRDKPEDVERERKRLEGSRGRRSTGGEMLSQRQSVVVSGFTVREVLRSRAFYFMAFGVVAANFSYAGILTQLIPHLQKEGVSVGTASLAMSVFAAFGMVGKLLFGLLSERVPARFMLMASLSIQVIGLFLLTRFANTPFLWAIMPFYGIGFGAVGALIPLLVQETFGVKFFGSILGIVNMTTVVAVVSAPLMVGGMYDALGDYRMAFLSVAGVFTIGALALLGARPPKAKAA